MIAGNAPGASGHTAKQGCRPYLVETSTWFSIMVSSSSAEKLPRAGDQHVVDPDIFHEVFAHRLAGGVNSPGRIGHGLFHRRVLGIAAMAERLREIEHAEAHVVDARQRREFARNA